MTHRSPADRCGAGWDLRAALVLTVTVCITAQTSAGSPLHLDPQVFLEKYGYLHQDSHIHNTAEVQSAIREFQWLSRLPVTGDLDSATLRRMSEPRCGVSDEGSQEIWAQRVNVIFTGKSVAAGRPQRHRKRSATQAEKWYKHHLTYRIVNWPRHLSLGSVRLVVRAAFQVWSNVSGLVFQESPEGPADIRLAFYEGDHNDGISNAFDGPGGTLAHAFLPRRGEAHFDMAERWTLNGHKGHNLFMVTAHEIGHTLGLEHSPVRHALMSPYYRKLGRSLVLSWDDIIAVQQLYGKPSGDRPVRLPGQVLHARLQEWEFTELHNGHETTGQPLYCQGVFDAITVDQNNTVLVFRGSVYWTVSAEDVSGPMPLRQRWSELPLAIEAAAFSALDSKWYFFKGKRIWRYTGSVLDPGFPRKSADLGLPRHPDCAFYYHSLGHMVLFKGSRYFVLNLKTMRQEPYYPRRLTDWTGVPQGTNGALSRPDGRLYLFRQQRFWRFDPVKVRVTREGQWAKELSWIGCFDSPERNNIL
ncbi:matrix metalloproteinase-28 [Mastacembelus armatus]|uniref:Matrix metallopeptidase 28 n=1 Tax=Mastacembelus armatus TaxID=205130 RepID=A0A3Q3LFM8_9TELE|nr:matrix metalloproteinase-28 [Mastacembelus armatus]XP_026154250.1 matrix metalloproteinase-28 [Mastacembelus armatus]XP_026154251.1 matrix metalloproteinase-28 [Mastacembelus armatus]